MDDSPATARNVKDILVLVNARFLDFELLAATKQPLDPDLTAIAILGSAADKMLYATGPGAWALADLTPFARTILDDASQAAVRTTLGITGTGGDTTYLFRANNLSDLANAGTARTNLGVAIGSNVQAFHANLSAFAGLSLIADRLPYANGAGTLSLATFTAAGRALIDDADAAAQRATLGLVIGTNVQAQDSELSAISGLTSAADRVPYFTGSGTAALTPLTAAGRALIDDADASAQRTTLGLSSMALQASTAIAVTGGTIVGLTSPVGIGTSSPASYLDGIPGLAIFGAASAGVAVANASQGYIAYVTAGGSFAIYDSIANLDRLTINTAGDIQIPNGAGFAATPAFRVGTYGFFSETGGGLAMIIGNNITADPAANNQLKKNTGDAAQFIGMRYDRGITFHSNITGGGGSTAADTVNERMRIDLNGHVNITNALRLGNFTVGTVPSAATAQSGATIYVSNESGGACIAFSNGSVWKRSYQPAVTIS